MRCYPPPLVAGFTVIRRPLLPVKGSVPRHKHKKHIYIVGAPGSGKSFVAKRLAGMLHVPWHDLDGDDWLTLSDEELSFRQQSLTCGSGWIFESVFPQRIWSGALKEADAIYLIATPKWIRVIRVLWRHLLKRLGVKFPGHHGPETLSDILFRIHSTLFYEERIYPDMLAILAPFSGKVFVAYNNADVVQIYR